MIDLVVGRSRRQVRPLQNHLHGLPCLQSWQLCVREVVRILDLSTVAGQLGRMVSY